MTVKAMCANCNEFLNEFNESFSLDSFVYEHYKTKYCLEDSIGLDGNKISCLTIYGERVKYFSSVKFALEKVHNQPERSKREDSHESK